MRRSHVAAFFVITLPAIIPACGDGGDSPAPAAAATGCTKDTDCKGDRVCEAGQCVSPTGNGGAGGSGGAAAGAPGAGAGGSLAGTNQGTAGSGGAAGSGTSGSAGDPGTGG